MPQCDTKYFGTIAYDAHAVIEFPAGLVAFEQCRRFLPVEDAGRQPLLFLQSLEDARLCFITVPVLAVDPGYTLKMSGEDLAQLGRDKLPAIGPEALCLAIVAMADGAPAANLLAPIVVDLVSRRAVQSIRDDTAYSCRHPLAPVPEAAPCS